MTSRVGAAVANNAASNLQAGITAYRYAFSGQIVDANSGAPLRVFSVSLLGGDSSVVTVINPLGQSQGLFHVSRDASASAASTGATVVISSPGYQSAVQAVEVGTDCTSSGCSGKVPQIFALKTALPANLNPSPVTPNSVASGSMTVPQQLALADDLQASGKLETSSDITAATVSKAVVLLNPQTAETTVPTVSTLLSTAPTAGLSAIASIIGTITSAILPWLATIDPQLGAAFTAIKLVLTYLDPLINQVLATNTNPFVQIVAAVLQAFVNSPATTTGTTSTNTLASVGLGSLPSSTTTTTATTSTASTNPFANILTTVLKNPSAVQVKAPVKSAVKSATTTTTASLVSNYLSPLIQALNSSAGPTLATLFNQLVQQVGLSGLAQFPTGAAELDQYGKLAPYLQSLVQGLNNSDAAALTQLLTPVINSANPAGFLQQLLNPANAAFANVANAVFPALQIVTSTWVPGKQVLGAQMLNAVFGGRLSSVQVQQDLAGAPSLVMTGNATSLLKMAQLPNVEKVVVLSGN
jgi:hypothetical protein